MSHTYFKFILPGVLVTLLGLSKSPVQALTINTFFVEPGETFPMPIPDAFAGEQPTNITGDGDFAEIFNVAANIWESLIEDDHTIDIYFGWANLEEFGFRESSTATGPTWQDTFPATTAFVVFNNNNFNSWYLDPTPEENEEYKTFTESTEDLGGGLMTVGRMYEDPVGDAVGSIDLLTSALHEMSHNFGFLLPFEPLGMPGNTEITFPTYEITADLPFAGSVVPTVAIDDSYIEIPTALMSFDRLPNMRQLPTEVDVIVTAQASNFTQLNLSSVSATQTPEPNSLVSLLTFMGFGLGSTILKFSKFDNNKN